MVAVGGFAGDCRPWGFPEPEPVTVTFYLRVQSQLTQHNRWLLDPEISRCVIFLVRHRRVVHKTLR
ncbi:MAG: hypothetical protein DRJ61_16390 [Acidobacteria bacterium]|nr:MAG: hypothetical protein DRJ61_16390 [Acidobacteriota bacterium]